MLKMMKFYALQVYGSPYKACNIPTSKAKYFRQFREMDFIKDGPSIKGKLSNCGLTVCEVYQISHRTYINFSVLTQAKL